jgi:hypothetical protein
MLESHDVVFTLPRVNPKVEEFGVGVALVEVSNSGSHTLAGPLKRHKTFNPAFQIGAEPTFILGESAGFLSHVQLQDDIQGHEEL